MSEPSHPSALPIDQLLVDCRFERTKRGGPGGQHRNKTQSAVVVTHLPTGVSGQASERRSQHANREVAIGRLRLNLALAVRRSASESELRPSELWRSRTADGKIRVSTGHFDYAALLAEAMDVLATSQFDLPKAASVLGVSSSQLLKFLKTTPAAFEWLNQERTSIGQRPLR
jgi:hypothetical protein